jgi:hypothetical protein
MAHDSHGTVIKVGDGTDASTAGWNSDPTNGFTTIAEVRDSEGPNMGVGDTEVTYHNSPSSMKQYIPGLIEGGEVTIPVNWLPGDSTHDSSTGLLSDLMNRTKNRDFCIVLSDTANSVIYFTGYVKAFEPSHPVEGALQANITLKVDGKNLITP